MIMSDEPKPLKAAMILDSGARSMRLVQHFTEKPMRPPLDVVSITPTLTGARGRAWLCNLPFGRLKHGIDPAKDCTIDHWVIEAEWAHPLWHSYSLVLMSTREFPGVAPSVIYLKGATHEFFLHALDPGDQAKQPSRTELISTGFVGRNGAPHMLNPTNFAAQFIAEGDHEATTRVVASVRAIIDGILSPDTDALSDWQSIWGGAMIKEPYR